MERDPALEKIAVLIVVNCFRNTVLENYHAEWPQFTDEKMKALMKSAVDRTYTALCGIVNPATPFDQKAMIDSLAWNTPTAPQWDRPHFDQNMLASFERAKTLNGKHPVSFHNVVLPSWDDTEPDQV
jgi:hypothetical protein